MRKFGAVTVDERALIGRCGQKAINISMFALAAVVCPILTFFAFHLIQSIGSYGIFLCGVVFAASVLIIYIFSLGRFAFPFLVAISLFVRAADYFHVAPYLDAYAQGILGALLLTAALCMFCYGLNSIALCFGTILVIDESGLFMRDVSRNFIPFDHIDHIETFEYSGQKSFAIVLKEGCRVDYSWLWRLYAKKPIIHPYKYDVPPRIIHDAFLEIASLPVT